MRRHDVGGAQIKNRKTSSGRWVSQRDLEGVAPVCVLGYKLKEQLFGGNDALGQQINLGGRRLTVVGVGTEFNMQFVNDDDMPHTVTADDKSYDSGDLQKGASWTHRFLKVGSSTYTCTYHAFMRGGVEVTAP